MVGSVFPFLSVLGDPGLIRDNAILASAHELGGFTSDYGFIVALGMGAIAVIIAANLVLILQTWALERYTQMRVHSISRRLLAHYLAQPYDFFLGHHSGDMSTNILSEAQFVVQKFLRPLADLISGSLTVVAVVVTLLIVEPLVASVAIGVFVAIYGSVTAATRRYVRRMGQERARTNEARFRMAGEALGGIKDVKLLGSRDRLSRQVQHSIYGYGENADWRQCDRADPPLSRSRSLPSAASSCSASCCSIRRASSSARRLAASCRSSAFWPLPASA